MCQPAVEPFSCCPDIGISNHDHLPTRLNAGVAMVYIFVPLWLFHRFAEIWLLRIGSKRKVWVPRSSEQNKGPKGSAC